ncbi:MAG: trypsin-like peptidase domain-containing protein, partial [Actinomycetota bacterium]
EAGGDRIVAVVRRVLPAVVNVTTDQFQPGVGNGQGVGTGFVVRSDGVIVTNCHVVEGANKITVFSSDDTPKEYSGRVIGGDCEHDLAIVKIDGKNLATVPLGSSADLALGQRVIALGYALALDGGPTVTTGIVSSLGRTIRANDPNCGTACGANGTRVYADIIQTDAAINPGNSGGPLVNLAGQVVAINSAGSTAAENIGFSIPIDAAKDTIAQAESDPLAPVAYLGVIPDDVTAPALSAQVPQGVDAGAYVLSVVTKSPAAEAGIHDGDVIVAVGGRAVADRDALGKVLAGLAPDQDVSVDLVGPDGTARTITVTLGTRPLPTDLP